MALRHMILGLLESSPMHGYLLRQKAREYSWIYPTTNAGIYPALHSLEDDGLVRHESQIHMGRARKIYHITDTGRGELRRWLAEPTMEDQSGRDKVLLKVALLSDEVLADASHWIKRSLEEYRQQIETYDRIAREPEAGSTRFDQLTNGYRAEVCRLRVRFLERVLSATDEPAGASADCGLAAR